MTPIISSPVSSSSRALPRRESVAVRISDKPRSVQPEILDTLSQDSPDARSSRRDLRIINRLLGSTTWFGSVLVEQQRPGEHVLEIGAGTGEMGRALIEIVPTMAGLDRVRRPPDWPSQAQWFETDVLTFAHWADYPVVIGSLLFHHFECEQLRTIGAQLNRHARVIIASEPLRVRRTGWLLSLLCPLIRAHSVTRYDARASIAAGFRYDELPKLLQLDPALWSWRVQETLLGSYRLVAVRRL